MMHCRKILSWAACRLWLLPTLGASTMLTACLEELPDPRLRQSTQDNTFHVDRLETDKNQPPSISGTPSFEAPAGNYYFFSPSATDTNGELLTFAVTNKPRWASFDPRTGNLSGTPTDSDLGASARIKISVSNGKLGNALPSFNLVVTKPIAAALDAGEQPTIDGAPVMTATVSESYSFQPIARDPDGDPLFFGIVNQPRWLEFDTRTGALSGTPGQADVGIYRDVMIVVSDGTTTTRLDPFTIEVRTDELLSATVSWEAPTVYENGSALIDLAGFKIHYRSQATNSTIEIDIRNPGVTTYVVDGLVPGTYYFATAAYTQAGLESRLSNEIAFTVN